MPRLTRRHLLQTGAAALGRSAALQAQAPVITTGAQTGRIFRGIVRHSTTIDVQELRLLPIDPRQVVIRAQAAVPCYTIVRGALGTTPARRAEVPSHCGFGVVEAHVRAVRAGDS